ncbi:hypothetical protein NT6N_35970 [Oceaniferula spumae]|uniref:Sialidase domain-containing protein n=1 Tax=Oceaniferula spumae TaxID=2979115 RepID=A0AAT9FQY1_9BACT
MKYLVAIAICSAAHAVEAPRIVATPPADAGRGLIRVSQHEIRHYPGKNGKQFLQSLDNGETWRLVDLPKSYPNATCLTKESPAIAKNPVTKEFIRFEPLYRGKSPTDGIYTTTGGIDGKWNLVTDHDGDGVKIGGILRSPLWVNQNKRIVIPGHGGGCWTWYSDDQGQTWNRSNKVQSPAHKPGGVHKGTRWNHGMVEATITVLKNKKLWLVARTAQDQHYQSFSSDYGKTWSEAEPSRFWGTITMPTFHRMTDGRLLFLWSNTTALPEVETATGRGEDVFTNRDTIHAAISEDDGKTWSGFRELILDEHRNNLNYAVTSGSNDRGKHQSEVVQLDDNRVLFSCGQHPIHRRLMIMDVRWLYEKKRGSDLAKDGTRDWSTHQYINKIVGHCGYNRKPGAQVNEGALQVLRVDDKSLTNENQGAVWNFPTGQAGTVHTKIRLEKGGAGIQLCLTDRWFNPTDATVDQFANYVLSIDANGMCQDKQLLTPGKSATLSVQWNVSEKSATILIGGKRTTISIPLKNPCPNGISYIHFYNPATETDLNGFSIFKAQAQVK